MSPSGRSLQCPVQASPNLALQALREVEENGVEASLTFAPHTKRIGNCRRSRVSCVSDFAPARLPNQLAGAFHVSMARGAMRV